VGRTYWACWGRTPVGVGAKQSGMAGTVGRIRGDLEHLSLEVLLPPSTIRFTSSTQNNHRHIPTVQMRGCNIHIAVNSSSLVTVTQECLVSLKARLFQMGVERLAASPLPSQGTDVLDKDAYGRSSSKGVGRPTQVFVGFDFHRDPFAAFEKLTAPPRQLQQSPNPMAALVFYAFIEKQGSKKYGIEPTADGPRGRDPSQKTKRRTAGPDRRVCTLPATRQ